MNSSFIGCIPNILHLGIFKVIIIGNSPICIISVQRYVFPVENILGIGGPVVGTIYNAPSAVVRVSYTVITFVVMEVAMVETPDKICAPLTLIGWGVCGNVINIIALKNG